MERFMAKSLPLLKEHNMKKFTCPNLPRLLGTAALLLFAGLAQAQYVWIDEKGVRQFSDRPPPPSTPPGKILKAPGKPSLAELVPEKSAEQPSREAARAGPPTLAERDAEYRKRAQERAKQEQKDAAEAQHKRAQAENCDNARRAKALMESDARVGQMDANGERSFMSDEERAKNLASANKVVAGCR
jgi:hypothetical protein